MSETVYNFQVVSVGTSVTTVPSGINNSGTIVGTTDPNGEGSAGFSGTTGSYATFTYPQAIETGAYAINASGTTVGAYDPGMERISTNGYELTGTTITDISTDFPVTVPQSINSEGDVAGLVFAGAIDEPTEGYLDVSGQVTEVAAIGQVLVASITGINDSGDYVGNFVPYPDDDMIPPNPPQDYNNFAFEVAGGTTTIIDYPDSYSTQVTGINNNGEIVGYYYENAGTAADPQPGAEHGFVYANGEYQSIDYPGTTSGTAITGVNDLGQIVGTADGIGFLATPPACYCRGTRILTPRGEVAVEALRIGDRLITHSGAERPIRWIGRRSYSGRFVAGNPDVLPVLIRAGALADGIPRRDLQVSPHHAMFLDGMLVPAAALANGITIEQAKTVARVDYFHVELETHDVILAEGAASETFVDDDSRGIFQNAAEYHALYPHTVQQPARYCAPRLEGGAALEAVLQGLMARTGAAPVAAPPVRLLGNLELVGRERIIGWAHDVARPDRSAQLRILDNGIEIGRVAACLHRPDLRAAGIGFGRGGFDFIVPGGLSPLVQHVIDVQRAEDGRALANSPWVVAAEQDTPSAPWLPATAAGMDGYIDELTPKRISGWVRNIADPERPVALQILDNGLPIARLLANGYRPDLLRTKPGTGRYGFEFDIPGGLSPLIRHVIQFRREPDGRLLGGPPFVIEAADRLDHAVEQAITDAVAAAGSGAAQERLMTFFMAQAESLRQNHAEADCQRAERLASRRDRRRSGQAVAEEPAARALVIDERAPLDGRDAGSQAVLSHIRALQRLGHAVSFAAPGDMALAGPAAAALAAAGVALCGAPFYTSVEDVLRRQANGFDVIYLHRADSAACYLALARRCNPRARILYSVADLHHVRLARQAAVEDRPELLAASRWMRMTETVAAVSANAVITHSAAEADLLRQIVPQANIHRVAWDIPVAETQVRFAARHGIAFVGAYSHAPNVDAAHWLVEAIMPLVWQTDPSIACLLVGTDMPKSVKRLGRLGVVAMGQVDDLRASVFDRVRLTVAPLRYGAGINGKVLASLAAGIPCVMSTVAAEGMPLCRVVGNLVGGDAATLASLICKLHNGRAANGRAATAGLAMIRREFSASAVTASLDAAIAGRDAATRAVAASLPRPRAA